MLKKGVNQKEIAENVGLFPSSILREVTTYATKKGNYNNRQIQMLANENTPYSSNNMSTPGWINGIALKMLVKELRSFKQIIGWQKKEKGIRLSRKTICQRIRRDKQEGGGSQQELLAQVEETGTMALRIKYGHARKSE